MTSDDTEYDPEKDPFACGICGVYLPESERIAGRDYCIDHRYTDTDMER